MNSSNLDDKKINNFSSDGETEPVLPQHPKSDEDLGVTIPVSPSKSAQTKDITSQPEPENLDATIPSQPINASGADYTSTKSGLETATNDVVETVAHPENVLINESDSVSNIPPGEKPTNQKRKPHWGIWLLVGILIMVVTAAFSIYSGYQSGIADRQSAELTQTAAGLDEQYSLAIQDLEAGRFEIARQRLDYIIQINPSYPGVIDNLAKVELALNATATPTLPPPTPTTTPTPDTSDVDAQFDHAVEALNASEWSVAIDQLLSLRKADPTYKSVDVDGMLYLALRNRGVDKILKEADLEGGTYDLALSERFGPLDVEASNYRIWVNLYMTGASFWDIDWAQAVYYFSQLYPLAPGLRDASGWTVTQRYSLALSQYAEQVARDDDWCQAQELYESALAVGADSSIQELAAEAAQNCSGGNQEDQPSDDQNNTGDITIPAPTDSQPTPLPSYP